MQGAENVELQKGVEKLDAQRFVNRRSPFHQPLLQSTLYPTSLRPPYSALRLCERSSYSD